MEAEDSKFYVVKHVRFKRSPLAINESVPVLLQDVNGPCPILAIFNILLLRGSLKLPGGVGEVLQSKVVQMLAEYLLDRNFAASDSANEDMKANMQFNLADAISLLPRLTTGIDVNVRFNDIRGVEFTAEVAVFDLLGIDLVHGWLVDPQDVATCDALKNKTYNEIVYEVITNLGGIGTPMSRRSSTQPDTGAPSGSGRNVDTHGTTSGNISQSDLTQALESVLQIQQSSHHSDSDTSGKGRKLAATSSIASQDSVVKAISSMLDDTVRDVFKTPKVSTGTRDGSVASRDSIDASPRVNLLSSLHEDASHDDIVTSALVVREFLENNPSQLTVYGIACLSEQLAEGQLAVFFRNNHFNVLLKHEGCLYILVTDQGYQHESDIVWEKLTCLDGDTEFVDGNFKPFRPHSSGDAAMSAHDTNPADQENTDFALALQLQQQEEHQAAVAAAQREEATSREQRRQQQSAPPKKKKSICSIM